MSSLDEQGEYAEALPRLQKGLDIRRRVLSEMHPYTADSYNNVASNLDGQGKHAEALPLYHQAPTTGRIEPAGEANCPCGGGCSVQ